MKILDARFISNRPSGIGEYTFRLLKLDNFDGILVQRDVWNNRFDDTLRSSFSVVIYSDIHPMSAWSNILYAKILFRLRKKIQFFYPHYSPPILFIKNTTVVVHDVFPIIVKNYYSKLAFLKVIHFKIYLHFIRFARKIIYASEITKERVEQFSPKLRRQKNEVLLPIDLVQTYKPKIVDENSLTMIYLGDCRPHKNIEQIIAVFKSLKQNHNIRLLFVGPEDEFLNSYRNSLNRAGVDIIGKLSRPELYKVLNTSDILISLSIDEGFGIPAHEAASLGLRLILSDIEIYRRYCQQYMPMFLPIGETDSYIINNMFNELIK